MNWQPKQDFYSITDYLKNELESDSKHEYIDGKVYAMAGASRNHQHIIMNLGSLFRGHLRGTPCSTFSSDIKVKISDFAFFYPDVIVACDDDSNNPYYTEKPLIIVEVLSKSTRRKDETTKRRLYQSLPSLQEYVLIEQDIVDIEVCRRSEGWQPEHYFMGDDISFAAIDLTVSVNEIYERVENEDVRTFFETVMNNPQ
jgi:Uma2 family endonuclease